MRTVKWVNSDQNIYCACISIFWYYWHVGSAASLKFQLKKLCSAHLSCNSFQSTQHSLSPLLILYFCSNLLSSYWELSGYGALLMIPTCNLQVHFHSTFLGQKDIWVIPFQYSCIISDKNMKNKIRPDKWVYLGAVLALCILYAFICVSFAVENLKSFQS